MSNIYCSIATKITKLEGPDKKVKLKNLNNRLKYTFSQFFARVLNYIYAQRPSWSLFLRGFEINFADF